jgi:hypothetical protein
MSWDQRLFLRAVFAIYLLQGSPKLKAHPGTGSCSGIPSYSDSVEGMRMEGIVQVQG